MMADARRYIMTCGELLAIPPISQDGSLLLRSGKAHTNKHEIEEN